MIELSVLIPSRNEEFLERTIQDLLEHIQGNTEIIAVLDGYIPNPPLTISDPRVTLIYLPESVGQRAATNKAAKLAKGKYLMKSDAHVAFDNGFDVKMLQAFAKVGDNVTMFPLMRNLHVWDFICPDGHEYRHYQGRSDEHGACPQCGKKCIKDVVWIAKPSPQSSSFRFDKTLHFQYFRDYSQTVQGKIEYEHGLIAGYNLSFDTRVVSSEIVNLLTSLANSHQLTCSSNSLWFRQNVSMDTVGFSSINNGRRVRPEEIFSVRDKVQMAGITTPSILTEVIDNGNILSSTSGDTFNQPGIEETVCQLILSENSTPTISTFIDPSEPIPAPGSTIKSDLIEKFNSILRGEFVYNEKTSKFHNGSVILSPIYSKGINESMSIQGSCFMLTKEKYFELDICSEQFHSWGQQGVEVACKTWLSGGRVLCNRNTWYAHMFRTQGGDFSFPYSNPQSKVNENRELSRQLFQQDKWDKATRPFSWILDHFNPPDWSQTKGMIYYTNNQLDEKIAKLVRDQLLQISQEDHLPIVSASLKKLDFGNKNIRFPSLKSGPFAMFKQILGALENSSADIIFFTEHDVLYHPSHFDFEPEDKNIFYFNNNVWKLDYQTGKALKVDKCEQLSGMCAYRDTAIAYVKQKLKDIESGGFDRHFEPQHSQRGGWLSKEPNIDIRHDNNLTPSRWSKEQFRNVENTIGWTEGTCPQWAKEMLYSI